jgi:hypothetical protein
MATWSGQTQNEYGVSGGAISQYISNFDFGGLRGLGYAAGITAQLILELQNLNTAKNYYNTNKKDFDFFQSTYEPTLQSALTEAMNRPLYESGIFLPQYGTLDYISNTARGVSQGPRKLDREWFMTRRRLQKYHVGVGRWIDYKYVIAKMGATLDGWNLGFRYEDTRKQAYDEQRHAHRLQILNLGIGVGNAARAGLATAVGTLSEARTEAASGAATIANGAARSMAYQNLATSLSKATPQQLSSRTMNLYPNQMSSRPMQDPYPRPLPDYLRGSSTPVPFGNRDNG